MSASFENQLFLASAGTGKTYQLSAHFVGLLLRGVTPDRILATTFTRKAAGEILDRVLQRLVEVATDAKKAAELSQAVGFEVTCAQAMQSLPGLARQIHRFCVRTLDSHTIQVARLFEAELGLPAGWSIVDEVSDLDLQDEALIEALQGQDEQTWMTLLRGLDPSGERRGVFEHMRSSIQALRQLVLESNLEAWSLNEVPAPPDADALEALLGSMDQYDDFPKTKKGTSSANWVKAWVKLGAAAREGRWEEIFGNKFLSGYFQGDRYYNQEYPETIGVYFEPIYQQAKHAVLKALHERNLASFALVEHFEETYGALKRSQGLLRFEDLPRFLDPLSEHNPFARGSEFGLEDIWLRMDARIDHLLLDEFQDTSSVQWRTLERMVEEITSTHGTDVETGRTLFCVGDIKQSIYGWRQAEPRLLPMIAKEYGLKAKELKLNFRSSPQIMEVCNQIFESIAQTPLFSEDLSSPEAQAAQEFQAAYPPHEAHYKEMGGCVQLWQTPLDVDHEDPMLSRLYLAARRIVELHKAAPHATIGILFRARKSIPRLLHILSEKFQVRASGEGGNPLTDSEAVSVIASLLHWLDHPADMAAAFHVATSALGATLGLASLGWESEEQAPGQNAALQSACVQVGLELRAGIEELGLSSWLLTLRSKVQSAYGAWDQQRFQQLIDHSDGFQASDRLRPSRWARLIRETRVPSPWSAPIQAMTIHGSKGLEFDAVVLPDLDGLMARSSGLAVGAFRPKPDKPYERISLLPKKELQGLDASLQALGDQRRMQLAQEALNLLYVAITRAKHRLEFVLGPKPGGMSYANLLLQTLGVEPFDENHEYEEDEEGAGILRWSQETEKSWIPVPEEVAEGDPSDPFDPSHLGLMDAALVLGEKAGGDLGWISRSPSQAGEGAARSGEDCLRSGAGMARGTAWHQALETVEWIESGEWPLFEDWHPSGLAPQVAAQWKSDLQAQLAQAGLHNLFERPSQEAQVFRERRFWLPEDSGVLWSGSMDRLIVEFEGGKPVRARVIDFKTGSLERSPEEILEAYREQLEIYRRATALQFGLPIEAVSMTLAMLDRGEAIEVEA